METFSLLQTSLEQTITRHELETAAMGVSSLARGDCAKLQRELYGILVSGLTHSEALVFQAQLEQRQFPTQVVADSELPILHESFKVQRIERHGVVLIFTDAAGKWVTRPLSDLVFAAAGHFEKTAIKSRVADGPSDMNFRETPSLISRREYFETPESQFRMDFFFGSEPHRLHVLLTPENVMFYQEQKVRLRDLNRGLGVLGDISNWLPRGRLGQGFQQPEAGRSYPNFPSYEEEIRWHFYQFMQAGS